MNTAAFWALAAMIFVIPWENTLVFPGLGSIARLVAVVATLLGVCSIIVSGRVRRPHIFHVLGSSFLLWSVFTLVWTINIATTRERTMTYALAVVLTWLIWQLAATEARQFLLLQAYVLGGYVPAVDTLRLYVSGNSWQKMRFAATGFNPNEIAMILVLGIPMAWYLALSVRRRSIALLNACYIPLALLAVLLTASRGGFLSALAALTLIPWSLQRLSVRARLGMGVLLLGSMLLIAAVVPQESWDRIGETAGNIEEGNFTKRELIWDAALELSLQHPIIGIGAGTFVHAAEPLLGRDVTPHQTFLSVLVGQGLVGLGLFLAVLVAAVWRVFSLRGLQRKFTIVLALTLFIGLLPRTWDYRKPMWFALAVITAQSALLRRRDSSFVHPSLGMQQASTNSGIGAQTECRRDMGGYVLPNPRSSR
jgi:O-antigen ligase